MNQRAVDVIEDNSTDNRILECALATGAKITVTGDKILSLGSFLGVSIGPG